MLSCSSSTHLKRELESEAGNSRRNGNALFSTRGDVARIVGGRTTRLGSTSKAALVIATIATTTATTAAAATASETATTSTSLGRNPLADSYAFVRQDSEDEGYSCIGIGSREAKDDSPLDDTPAPISMSGSSMTIPPSRAFPPVPPYSAVKTHFRSASVSREIGITLIPVS